MNEPVTLRNDAGIAVITIDNPPVNALSPAVIGGLAATVARAQQDPEIHGIVVVGAGRTFVAGADIKGLEDLAWSDGTPSRSSTGNDLRAPEMHDILAAIENGPKPVVMALHGTALGGGLEIAMAGHYRVALAEAAMGQPEVNLGIIPGAEGTQRLPRLVGVEKAIDMCVTGKPIKAGDALQAGLIDRIVEGDLTAGAVAVAREMAAKGGAHPRTRERSDKLPARDALPAMIDAGRELAKKVRRHMEAPRAVIDAIAAAVTLPFDEGCVRERGIFFDCVKSEQCKALIHAFFAERGVAKVPGLPKDAPVPPINTVAIIGAGTMGGGIAMACANAGLAVVVTDTAQEKLDAGLGRIRTNYDTSVRRGRFTTEDVQQRLGRIRTQVGFGGIDRADLVIEAVFENLALKKQLFGELDVLARPDAILATNTSTLDIDQIAAVTSRPDQVIGLHFFSPANVMRLLEIVRGSATSSTTVAAALAIAKRLGKVGVVVRNAPGFVGNRMMFPYMYEAQFLVEEGATPEQVDRALTNWGMAMGIFAVDDMAGLDVAWRVRQELGQFSEPGARTPLVADRLCEMGRFGQKTGSGWFRYGEDRKPHSDPEVIALIRQLASAARIPQRTFTDDEIVERTIYALINEGARVLEDGVALRAADIDVVYLTGYGFPTYRGGPMFYADRVGLSKIHERIEQFHRQHGERWAPAPLLARLAREGSTFRAWDSGRAAEPLSTRG
jgi:3-hydroxyacyl-CoA dehydrogenase